MIRNRIDRRFDRFRRTGDPRSLAQVFDATAKELWRVAVHLCRDRHAAEDAVQTTFLSAIEARTSWDASRPVLPWLLGLLANRVRELRRRAARVPDAERLPPAIERDPADVAADREVSATLRAALARLDEPYRTTLERHLVHGLAAHEIAAELSLPAGTLRMRLHRGLDRLREKLPAGLVAPGVAVLALQPEVLAAMRTKVLGMVPGGAAVVGSGHAGSLVIGVLLMSKVFWTVLVSGLVLLTAWWVWPPAQASIDERSNGVIAAAEAPPAAPVPTVSSEVGTASPVPERTAVASRGAAATGTGLLRVQVRVADSGAPVDGVWLEVAGGLAQRPPDDPGGARSVAAADAERTLRTKTDAEGTAIIELPVGFASVTVDGGDVRASAEVADGAVRELRLELPVRFTASVRVVDDAGRPVADARLVGSADRDTTNLVVREFGRTDPDGWCRIACVDDSIRVRARHPGCAASRSAALDPRHPEATLQLGAAPAMVTGLVADATGAPLADAAVALHPLSHRGDGWPILVRTDAAGRFACADVPPGRCLVLAVRLLPSGLSRLVQEEVEAIAGVETFVDLRFGGGAGLVVRLTNVDGTPVVGQDVILTLQHPQLDATFARRGTALLTTDARGEATAEDLLPGGYRLQVVHGGLLDRPLQLVAGAPQRFEHVFGAGPWLEVHVVDPAGEPLAGWQVTVFTGATGRRESTDADGRVRFADLAATTGRLLVAPDADTAPLLERDVTFGGELTVAVDPATLGTATLRGELVPPAGTPLADLQVVLVRGKGTEAARPITLPVEPATGGFTATRLERGDYVLIVMARGSAAPMAMRDGITVGAGAAIDLGRIVLGTGQLRVAATFADGAAVTEPTVEVGLAGTRQFAPMPGAADGLVPLPAGAYDLLIWGATSAPSLASVQVQVGVTTEVPLATRRAAPITLACDDPEVGDRVGMLTVRPHGESEFRVVVELVEGAAPMRGFVAGAHEVAFEDLEQRRYRATFTVGSDLAPQTVTLRRAP